MDPIVQTSEILLFVNFFLLLALILIIKKWQKKHGRITEKRLAFILILFFTFATITTSLPLLIYDFQAIIIDIMFILVFWTLGFWWVRWLYRNFTNPK